jgi:hypothetical protein
VVNALYSVSETQVFGGTYILLHGFSLKKKALFSPETLAFPYQIVAF